MAVVGWLVDKSAAVRGRDAVVGRQLRELSDRLLVCPIGELEQLYSAQSASEYDEMRTELRSRLRRVEAPSNAIERALVLQRDLAHHHGLWHRMPIPDLLIAETALAHNLGVLHVDGDYERIAEVRPLTVRRLG